MQSQPSEFDSAWKGILDELLPWFIRLFYPEINDEIDWGKNFESLDKELNEIASEAAIGKRFVDKLIKVYLKSGKDIWVYIHIEVQSQRRPNIPERIYIYNCLLYLRYRKPIMSLLVLGDDQPNWKPDCFEYNLWGSQVSLKFRTVKLLDYQNQLDELRKSGNPFAYFVIAHLKTLETKKSANQRLNYKEETVKEMVDQGLAERDVYIITKFIDIMMTLPKELEKQFVNTIHQYQEEKNMAILAPFEQLAKEEGRVEGREEEAREVIIEILSDEFGKVPDTLLKSINKIEDISLLRKLRKEALRVESLNEFNDLMKELV